ncbi:MAG: NERD domain-containing protein [Erysipelotrichaceae bacterium]|nr:NERD domain-containing protein [Erysipelotrichaceae bacterium]
MGTVVLFYILLILFIIFVFFAFYRSNDSDTDTPVTPPIIVPKKPLSEQEAFGIAGEQQVGYMLKRIAASCNGHVFNDYTFADQQGYSTNIDHLLICKGGLFIIETKANKGIIYGSDRDELWYAVKEEWQENREFKNPVLQNQGHINHLRRMMGQNPPKMISMIIFTSAKSLNNVVSSCTYDIDSASRFLMEKTKTDKYSPKTVERIYRELIYIREEFGISIEEHNAIVKDRFCS